jgi:hypothetical protein
MSLEALQPDVFIYGFRIQEPITTLTDVMISVASFYGYYRLQKAGKNDNVNRFLKLYFLFMGVATTLAGVLGHGLLYMVGLPWKIPGWFLSMIAIMLIERSSIEHAKELISSRLGKFFLKANLWELLILMGLTAYSLNFLFVEIHSAYGVLGTVFFFHLYAYRKTKDIGSKYMLWGVAVLVVATFVFNYPVVINKWFNHSDFAHVLMTITTILFMYGGLNFGKRPEIPPV